MALFCCFSLQFYRRLTEEMTKKRWENTPVSQPITTGTGSQVRNKRAHRVSSLITICPLCSVMFMGICRCRWHIVFTHQRINATSMYRNSSVYDKMKLGVTVSVRYVPHDGSVGT